VPWASSMNCHSAAPCGFPETRFPRRKEHCCTNPVARNFCYQAIALKTPGQGLSDNGDPIRQQGAQGQALALVDKD
jgi:hypothetical protein